MPMLRCSLKPVAGACIALTPVSTTVPSRAAWVVAQPQVRIEFPHPADIDDARKAER